MSVKAKIAAGAATLSLVGGGLAMVGTTTASAATPSCGGTCVNIFPQKYGPQYQVDVYQARAAAGQPIILFQSSNSDPAQDFLAKSEGTVASYEAYLFTGETYFPAGFVRAYANDKLYEFQYEPYGVNSNYCLSTWSDETPQAGYKVRLESCGTYANSQWAVDAGNSVRDRRSTATGTFTGGFRTDVPLINGADDNFSNPLVMNYPAGNPTDMPRPILNVQPESSYSNGAVFDNQEWGATLGANN